MKIFHSFVVLTMVSNCAYSVIPEDLSQVPYLDCFQKEANNRGVELAILLAIAEKESEFNPNALNVSNADGSIDVGIMQINSYWIKPPYVKEHFFEPCFNISFGAYVLRDSLERWGNNWVGVGKYNANSLYKGYVYTSDLWGRYNKYVRLISDAKKNGGRVG